MAGLCATPGSDGSGPVSGVINAYWSGSSNPSAGATSFQLGPASGANTPIAPGDLLMLFQTQDARIDSTNTGAYGDGVGGDPASGATGARQSGRYEFVRATSAVPLGGGTLNVASGVQFNYTTLAPTAANGQRNFQIVRVPQYLDASVSGTVTAAPWDGQKGGIVVMDVANTLTFAGGTIDVSARGFRGGGGRNSTTGSGADTDYRTPFSNGANGSKGEGVAGTPQLVWDGASVANLGVDGYPNGSFGRGAPGNAGGGATDGNPTTNDQNTGAGGGGGWGDGGRGGHAWCGAGPPNCDQSGGFGGTGLANQGVSRLSYGGGGGAGSMNNNTGIPIGGGAASGARGGGMVVLRAGTMTGNGVIRANGAQANQTVGNDGSGGGGGGGAVLLSAEDSASLSLSVEARGGGGGSNGNSAPHGPGGGGGGGFVGLTSGVSGATVNVAPGQPGTTDGTSGATSPSYGATAGQVGTQRSLNPDSIPGFSSGEECRVEVAKAFAQPTIPANRPVRLTLTLDNPNPDQTMSALTITDALPSGVQIASAPNAATTCNGPVGATAGDTTLSLSGGTLAPGARCTVSADVVATSGGTYDNVVPLGGASADIGGITVENTLVAEDSLSVTNPLDATKTVAGVASPGNPNAFQIPGEIVEYTIAFSNPAEDGAPVSDISLLDALPADLVFVAADIDGPGSGPAAFVDGSPSTTLIPQFQYSNDGGASYGYTPTGSLDASVTHVRFTPSGSMPAGTQGAIRFRMQIP